MTRLNRFAAALLWVLGCFVPQASAYTVQQMKEMETKVKQVVSKNSQTVVSLLGESVPGAGSGTIVSEDGIILTAAHVTQGNEYMRVVFPNGREVRCKVLGADYKRDVSLAKIEQPGKYVYAPLGDSDKLEVTTVVLAMGHPGGYDLRRTPPLRIGRIESKDLGGFLLSDATLISGDSGGPLFDLDGKVIGVHSSISESLSFNRCAPVNAAKGSWDRLLKGERWGNPLGSGPFDRNPNKAVLGGVMDAASSGGARVMQVFPKSPLEVAGLKEGDVIVRVGKTVVKSFDDLVSEIDNAKPGDKVELAFMRSGAEQKAEVTLVSRSEMNKRLDPDQRQRQRRSRKGSI